MGDTEWTQSALYGLFGVVGIVVGLPAYFSVRIWSNKSSLWETNVLSRLGGLYSLFRKPYYYLEVVNLMRRLAVVAASLFLATEPLLLLGTLAALFATLMVFFARARPHYYPLYTQAEFRLSVALTLILLLGGAAYAETGENSTAITILVYAACALLICLAVALVVQDIYDLFCSRRSLKAGKRPADYHLARYVRTMVGPFLADLEDSNVADAINANLDAYVGGGRLEDTEEGNATPIELVSIPSSCSSSSLSSESPASSALTESSRRSAASRSSRWKSQRSKRRVEPGDAANASANASAYASGVWADEQ